MSNTCYGVGWLVPLPSYRDSNELDFLSCLQNVHPFQFMGGLCNDALYHSEVRVCAQAFTNDGSLKNKVQGAAAELFANLAKAPEAGQREETSFMHMGLTFTVRCGMRAGVSESSSGESNGISGSHS